MNEKKRILLAFFYKILNFIKLQYTNLYSVLCISHIYFNFITDERVKASVVLPGSTQKFAGDKKTFLEHLRKALYASKLISYAQGFMLLREAAKVITSLQVVNIAPLFAYVSFSLVRLVSSAELPTKKATLLQMTL